MTNPIMTWKMGVSPNIDLKKNGCLGHQVNLYEDILLKRRVLPDSTVLMRLRRRLKRLHLPSVIIQTAGSADVSIGLIRCMESVTKQFSSCIKKWHKWLQCLANIIVKWSLQFVTTHDRCLQINTYMFIFTYIYVPNYMSIFRLMVRFSYIT